MITTIHKVTKEGSYGSGSYYGSDNQVQFWYGTIYPDGNP